MNKYLNINQIELLHAEIKNAPNNTTLNYSITRNCGAFPVLSTLGAILFSKPNIDNVIDKARTLTNASTTPVLDGDFYINNAMNIINNKIKFESAIDWGYICSFIISLILK